MRSQRIQAPDQLALNLGSRAGVEGSTRVMRDSTMPRATLRTPAATSRPDPRRWEAAYAVRTPKPARRRRGSQLAWKVLCSHTEQTDDERDLT